MGKINASYESQKPSKELLKFKAKELRHAANWIDREKGVLVVLNAVSMFKKLQDLQASVEINPDSSGLIKFDFKGQSIVRYFESASEMSIALNLGPLDLNEKTSDLYFKADVGVLKANIIKYKSSNNTVVIEVPEIDLIKYIYLNGAEKILCNDLSGMTIGQMKVREIR